ncbi:class I SAM-dependent methyltransferase [Planctomicrobium sp. SH668]|uniref:class I SAM-dependent methyltransferase n=1 Tax=Planctomicrobium sp. SH668 TaxID=3448126 RepID=UPI003F5BC9F7
MSWKLKAHSLAVLSRVPAGRQIYHLLQKLAGTNRVNSQRDMNRAFELVDLAWEAGETIENSTCVEIGTGWHPFVPFVLALGGAKQVVTIDVNPWLTEQNARETWRSLEPFLPEIAAKCRFPEHEVWDRYRLVPKTAKTINDFFDPLQIRYIYPGDARHTGFAEGSVDLVVSSNVLEHIPLDIQTEIHQESKRILRVGGLAVHRFNPQDHYSTVDSKITNSNFLQFTSKEWEWLGGSGLAYHNRLRTRDYQQMFEQIGFELEVCRERIDARSLEALKSGQLQVADEFNSYTLDELAADYMWVACRKPNLPSTPVRQREFNAANVELDAIH